MKKSDTNSLLDRTLKELWKIRNPHAQFNELSFQDMKKQVLAQAKKDRPLYPLPLPLSKKAAFELTTGRNRLLIDPFEQNKLRQTVVAFFGMSVGSHAALTWMLQSRADCIKISDPDTIDASNLNRLRIGWSQIGRLKVDVVADQLADINPFVNIISTTDTSPKNVASLFTSVPEIDIVIDEIDDFQSKILLRTLAKKYQLPLISAADVGDNIALDVERYDLDPQPEPFLGRVPDVQNINFSRLSVNERKKLIINLVGFEHNSEKMLDSLMAIGGSIPTWPQLGTTATLSGAIVSIALKKIVLGESVPSRRYYLSTDNLLVSDYNSESKIRSRTRKTKLIQQLMARDET